MPNETYYLEDDTVSAIEDRLSRARAEELSGTVVNDSPFVVTVHNDESGSEHTVVPNIVHCSCPDHTYRGYLCKHLLFLLGDDSSTQVTDRVRRCVEEHKNELERDASEIASQIQALEDELANVQGEIDQIVAAKDVLGISQLSESEAEDLEDDFAEWLTNLRRS